MHNPLADGKSRTLAGLALAAAIAPFLLALTGCLPVPLGDPEKSRIDPELSGVWSFQDEKESGGLWLMEPYDSRTWLVTSIEVEMQPSAKPTEAAPAPAPDERMLLEQKDLVPASLQTYKAWLTPIRNVRFLILEPKIVVNADGSMAPKLWLAFAVTSKGKDTLELRSLNYEFKGLKEVRTSAEARGIIAHNLEDPKLLEKSAVVLTRVPRDQYGRVDNWLKKLKIG